MLRGALLVIGVALAAVPGSAAGQEVGVSFRIGARLAQPDLVAMVTAGPAGLAARVPAGWVWSVERGSGGGSVPDAVREAPRGRVSTGPAQGQPHDQVTWTFVPL